MESIVNMLAVIMGGQKNVDFYLRGHKSPEKFEVWALGYVLYILLKHVKIIKTTADM